MSTSASKDYTIYEQVYLDVKRGQRYATFFCYGEDRGNLQTFIKSICDLLIPEQDRDFAVSRYDMREVAVQEALMDAETMPFMVDHKVVILDHALFFTAQDKKNDEEAENEEESGSKSAGKTRWTRADHDIPMLMDYLFHPAPFTTLIISIPGYKLDERKKIVSQLKKIDNSQPLVKMVPFEPLDQQHLIRWLHKIANKQGMQFAHGADEYFVHLNGKEQLVLRSELEKIAMHLPQGGVISEELVDLLGIKSFEDNVFKLLEWVVQKRIAAAHELLLELFKHPKENNPFLILNLLARQFRTLLVIKELNKEGMTAGQIASIAGSPPFVIKTLTPLANRLSAENIAEILNECADYDVAFKSGRVADVKLALEVFILKLAS